MRIVVKYKNVKRLYFDGKAQIENLTGQVEQLQNAVANQRITQSRTALDDHEYLARFSRLNGAVMNLAFNVRKDWKTLPGWLQGCVSADAIKTGKQEMTALGRAVISRWLVEELFEKCFHPCLDPELSAQLKTIELSIRGNAYTMHSQEEFDALTSKVVGWRMATLDGLQASLNSPSASENRNALITAVTTDLTEWLHQFLADPPPPGVEGSTSMIAELAVGIASNLPVESRDVAITYPLPGSPLRTDIMEVDKTALPPLEEGTFLDDDDDESIKSNGPKAGMLIPIARWRRAPGGELRMLTKTPKAAGPQKKVPRVRFAGFMAAEVRGRQVLMKAPVWTV